MAKRSTAKELQSLIGKLDSLKAQKPDERMQALKPIFGDVPAPLDAQSEELPGPTGELNRLSDHARGVVLCLGPDKITALEQAGTALSQGNKVVVIAPGVEGQVKEAAKAGLPIVGR